MPPACPFCTVDSAKVCVTNAHAIAFRDSFPISEGHTLVVPRRHVQSVFDLPDAERQAIWSLVAAVRLKLIEEFTPDGFNVGLNDGTAAGQTVQRWRCPRSGR